MTHDGGRRTRRTKRFAVALGCAMVLAAGTIGWQRYGEHNAAANVPPAAAAKIPVEIAAAQRTDVPVTLSGLGTVRAFNMVTVKPRVDGQIETIAFREGQSVSAGDLLAQIDPRPYQAQYDQAVARKVQDDAQLANARLDLQRYRDLIKSNATPQKTLDTQQALVAQLEGTVRADQAAIDAAKVQLDYSRIVSPIDGVTGIRQVDQGNIVHATDATGIVVVTQLQPISVVFTLPEETLPKVSDAMARGPVAATALARDGKTALDQGTVLLIDNQIDAATGTIRLKATFPNRLRKLWPGQFVNVQLLLQTDRNVLTIPSAAVQRGPDGLFAYAVRPDGSVEIRPVDVGLDNGAVAVVDGGLQDGEPVVTAGQYRLQPGALVQAGPASPAGPAEKDKPASGTGLAQRATP